MQDLDKNVVAKQKEIERLTAELKRKEKQHEDKINMINSKFGFNFDLFSIHRIKRRPLRISKQAEIREQLPKVRVEAETDRSRWTSDQDQADGRRRRRAQRYEKDQRRQNSPAQSSKLTHRWTDEVASRTQPEPRVRHTAYAKLTIWGQCQVGLVRGRAQEDDGSQ